MVDTIKRGVGRPTVGSIRAAWDKAIEKVEFGYCCRPLKGGYSPYQLLYGVEKRILPADDTFGSMIKCEMQEKK